MTLSKQFVLAVLFLISYIRPHIRIIFLFILQYSQRRSRDYERNQKAVGLDDFEYRLLVGCVNKARTMFIDEDKPVEGVSALLLKIIDAPTKKIKVRS